MKNDFNATKILQYSICSNCNNFGNVSICSQSGIFYLCEFCETASPEYHRTSQVTSTAIKEHQGLGVACKYNQIEVRIKDH